MNKNFWTGGSLLKEPLDNSSVRWWNPGYSWLGNSKKGWQGCVSSPNCKKSQALSFQGSPGKALMQRFLRGPGGSLEAS
ncbi:MAG: hypothetical protein JSS60_09115 [Verrucomicrobia bacterium]|nr:hypothetical protein [Verrucomicrobiota bacterium]